METDKINKFIKYLENFDEEFKLSDFSPDELEELFNGQNDNFKEKYFSYYNDVKSSSLKKQDW